MIESFDSESRKKKGYKRSYEVRDDGRGCRVAYCDLCGRVESSVVEITGENGGRLELQPNRKLMPSKWRLSRDGSTVYEIERAGAVKMMSPLARGLLTVRNVASGRELQLMNLTDSKLDLMFGPSTLDWYLVEGDTPVASLDRRKDPDTEKNGRGLLSKIGNLFVPSNWILVSNTDHHVLSGPAFLSMMLLHRVFTDAPG